MDDMILAGKDESKMENVKKELSSKFDIKDLGRLSYFLGMSIVHEQEGRVTWMGQPAYIQKLLTKTGMNYRFYSKPNQSHWTAAKRVLRYLKGMGILYKGDSGMQGYSDADWAGDTDDRKSTSGYMFLIAGGPVSWKSRTSTVALSAAEAEYVALSAATQECMWT